MRRIITHAIAALIGVGVAQMIFEACPDKGVSAPVKETVTEVVRIDTTRTVSPLRRDLMAVRFEDVKLPSLAITKPIFNADTMPDSVTVSVPIETHVFTDDSTYRAVISGFHTSLDTMDVYTRTVERERTVTVRVPSKPRRWGLSVGAGAVVTPTGRIEPGLFVGASYTFWAF